MTDFVIYGTPVSPFVRKVQAVLGNQDMAYDFENINVMDMPRLVLRDQPSPAYSGAARP